MNNKIFENHLVGETSPYLLQHIHNPVDWYPWGEEAFNKSKHEDKPIFLSIGYSACHWCHVMARESFEDESIAQILNENFICIKIDREQRPDIDSIYMRACQAATGSGGWPLSVFTDAEGKPFFAGTYYPKEFFYKILQEIAYQWKSDKDVILQKSEQFCDVLKSAENNYRANQSLSLNRATEAFLSEFDSEYGGFGNMPKFPTPHNLMFLLYTAPSTVEKTLDSMYKGGIFDHIGGGFSRYSTDRYWLVPHFEKMLYDNALLAIAYSMGFETLGKDIYKYVVKRIFEYLERDLLSPKGGFYSSQDADSEGEEGKFYLFSVDEIKKVLGEKEGQNFCEKYGIDANGNFRGKSIPNLLNSNDFETRYENELKKLFEYRKSRISPNIDTKILTSWNCLTAAAYAVAGRIFKNEEYIFNARKMAEFIQQNLFSDDVLISSVTEGKKSENSFLDDYAFYIYALIEIYEATFDEKYLTEAVEKTLQTQKLFGDANGGFYFSSIKNEKLILRPKETFDGATPSGNSVMSYNLNRLYILTENDILRELHIKQRKFMDANASIYPTGHGFYLYSCLPVKKVVCVPKIPKSLLVQSNWTVKEGDERIYPVINQKTTYYVCENETCHPPTNEISFFDTSTILTR